MEKDRFIEHKKREFKPGRIEYAYMDEFQSRFLKRSVKRNSFYNNSAVEYAALDIIDGFFSRMGS